MAQEFSVSKTVEVKLNRGCLPSVINHSTTLQFHVFSATALRLKTCKSVLHINARPSVEPVIYALHVFKVALVVVVLVEDANSHLINLQASTVGARDGSAPPIASAGA